MLNYLQMVQEVEVVEEEEEEEEDEDEDDIITKIKMIHVEIAVNWDIINVIVHLEKTENIKIKVIRPVESVVNWDTLNVSVQIRKIKMIHVEFVVRLVIGNEIVQIKKKENIIIIMEIKEEEEIVINSQIKIVVEIQKKLKKN
eukprot:CAMPEP_0201564662 /NCGR_PEP_ID=MMETSP0190_2-20130828/3177_1 /ASSEMBLY_ACC=CAM_ASM_000263 /TAXON_ID=37353 /ORGANISM="Rosalina sp." /LENGTH=142 /DNA_ID=CAMNT_0047981151 /DNA_START=81 /DNA_END=509 /DNA_ORIENTATION=+